MGHPVKKSGEHLSPDSLLKNQQQLLQKLWHQEWVVTDLGRSFAVLWIILVALHRGWEFFFLICQCQLSLLGCDLTGLQTRAAQLKTQMWFFPKRSFVRHQYLKSEKQTNWRQWVDWGEKRGHLSGRSGITLQKGFHFFSQKPLSFFWLSWLVKVWTIHYFS